jgi:hypothetical protein
MQTCYTNASQKAHHRKPMYLKKISSIDLLSFFLNPQNETDDSNKCSINTDNTSDSKHM